MASQPNFPPYVLQYIKQEIARRTEVKMALEGTPKYEGYDEFTRNKIEGKRKHLEEVMHSLAQDVIAITKKHFPHIEIDTNDEVTISNILAALPQPEELKRIRVISSRLGAPG